MTQVTKVDKAVANMLLAELNAAVQAVANKYGMKMSKRRATFGPTSFAFKSELQCIIGVDGVEVEKREFETYAPMLGLKSEWYGKSFTAGMHGKHTITGLSLNRRKYPVRVLKEADGKTYLWTVDSVKLYMSREEKQVAPATNGPVTIQEV